MFNYLSIAIAIAAVTLIVSPIVLKMVETLNSVSLAIAL